MAAANGYAIMAILWNGGKNNVFNIRYNLFAGLGLDRVRKTE